METVTHSLKACSFHKYLPRACSVLGTVLSTGDMSGNKAVLRPMMLAF